MPNCTRKTHCIKGHEFTPENTRENASGSRTCLACAKVTQANYRARHGLVSGVGQGGHNKIKTHCPKGHEYTEENTATYGSRLNRHCKTCARANSSVQVTKKHGLTVEEYENMLAAQSNACDICKEPFTQRPDIDHDHACCAKSSSCGECVCGLLCKPCNIALANLRDNPVFARSAADYLERTRVNRDISA